jgi:cytochrome c oxidase assembly factor CtaG
VTFVVWAAVILSWHLPALYDVTLRNSAVHDLEHASFVLVGVLAWTQLIDPARHERLRRPGRILFAVGILVAGHPVVDGLFFDGSPAYSAYARQDERLLGLSALADQRLAAFVMFVEQVLTLGTCIGVLLWPYLRERRARRAVPRTA